eukprot:Unigene11359_Nuclearia_a/m.34673 Unigene11359_Nuclearia_a/g.34673  ORF Unigene11359_Nuclearia_a/g.34673 Unigene11359_Nuclearia_a/m.34673 type:complete len:128 (-) Unigene11359_Nuclearia_a:11-394(-)
MSARPGMAAPMRDRRALVGEPSVSRGHVVASLTEDQLERQNDDHVSELGAKISALRSLTIDIGHEVRESNKLLDSMDGDFSRTGGVLGQTMARLKAFSETRHGMQMTYLVVFVVFVFFVAYFVISWR